MKYLAKLNIYSDKTRILNVISQLIDWQNFWSCNERFSGKKKKKKQTSEQNPLNFILLTTRES